MVNESLPIFLDSAVRVSFWRVNSSLCELCQRSVEALLQSSYPQPWLVSRKLSHTSFRLSRVRRWKAFDSMNWWNPFAVIFGCGCHFICSIYSTCLKLMETRSDLIGSEFSAPRIISVSSSIFHTHATASIRVIPQAVCVRYGLRIGAMCVPFVLGLMYVLGKLDGCANTRRQRWLRLHLSSDRLACS